MGKKLHRFLNHCLGKLADKHLETAVKLQFLGSFHRRLNLKHPETINEKFQWLKVRMYDNNPQVTMCADKYAVREYLTQKGLEELLPKLYGAYGKPEEIPWESLPEQFVIKCNHGSGFNILCRNKAALDIQSASAMLNEWLNTDYGRQSLETQYFTITRKIIAEQYLGDDIHTYKFYCFNGIPKVLYVSSNGENGEYDKYYDYFDMEWNHLEVMLRGHLRHSDDKAPGCPQSFSKMKTISAILSEDFPFVRIDLYDIRGEVYFSEMTFTPTGGKMHLIPEETEQEWGTWLKLPTDIP